MQSKYHIRRPLMHILVLCLSFVVCFNGTNAVRVSDIECINIYFEFDGLSFREESESITVSIDGAPMSFLQSNQYIVPTKVQTVYFPSGTRIDDVRCEPRVIHTQSIMKDLTVTPSFQCLDPPTSYNSDLDIQEPFSLQRWFDYSVGHGIVENKRVVIVTIQVYPIQYHPLDSRIDWAEEIDIHIDHTLPSTIEPSALAYDYIILTPQEFSTILDDLASHKNERGISTKVITLDEIYLGSYFPIEGRDQQEQIKYFIKNAYDEWGISYVLLVGGSDHFPVRKSHLEIVDEGSTYTCEMASDLYYADIYNNDLVFSTWDSNENNVFGEYNWNGFTDDIDLYPDVHIGRIPCITEGELQSVIEKIIEYEDTNAYTQDWFTRFVVVGGDSAPDDEEDIDEGEYATENAINIMQGFTPTRIWASNGDLYSKVPLNKALNNGAGFSYFSGHGNKKIWSTHPHNNANVWLPPGSYSSFDVGVLNNNEEQPIVILDACYVGQFDAAADCFSWSFLRNRDGGCIGIFSSTYTSFFYPTSYVTEDLIGKMSQDTLKAYRIDGAITLGEMWTNALNRYISANMDGADYFTVEEWLLMGDPTLMIAKESTPPEKPSITGPSNGKPGDELSFTASTTDIDGDKVYYLFDWGDDTYSEWFGPYESGELCTDGRNIWQSKGEYSIRVQAKDEHGTISEWSDPLPISMVKSKSSILFHIQDKSDLVINLRQYTQTKINRLHQEKQAIDKDFDRCRVMDYPLIAPPLTTQDGSIQPVTADLPSSFSWKDLDGQDWTTPAKDQGNCGSCWDFAAMGALEAMINIQKNDPTIDMDLSEQYILSCLPAAANYFGEGCLGGNPYNAFKYIKNDGEKGNYCNGIITEDCFYYYASHIIPCEEKCLEWQDELIPIEEYGFTWPGIDFKKSEGLIKSKIYEHGPVAAGIDCTNDFIFWGLSHHDPTEYYPYSEQPWNNQVNHLIVIVGWNDDPLIPHGGYWICKNSWGTDWGYDGFYNVEYGGMFSGAFMSWASIETGDENKPPLKPDIPNGPSKGKINNEYIFSASTTDPDNDKVCYRFDWGDETYSDWSDLLDSGDLFELSHCWETKKEYSVKVMAKDEHGKKSDWSDPLPVSMQQPKTLFNQRIMNWFDRIAHLLEKLKKTDISVIDDCGCCDDEIEFPYNVVSQRSLIDENLLMSINEHENTYPFTSAVAASDLPAYFNWKDMDGKDFTTPAKHQANCGSCWDFAGVGAIEAVINIKENDSTLDPDLSEQYVLSCLPDAANNYAQGCYGGQPVNAFHCIMSESDDGNYCNGVIWETCFDYCASHEIDCSEKCEDWLEYLVPLSDYGSFWNQGVLENTEQSQIIIKNALMQHGPVGSFMDVPDSFIRWGERHHDPTEYCPYEDRTFNNQLNHAILIVGWKDDPAISQGGYWICKNSWGMDWGYDGFYNIEYGNHFTGFRIDWVDYDPASYNWEPYQGKPYKPTIQGPSNGKLETEHIFTAMSTDPSNEQLYYLFDWDDESNSEWLGPFASGETCETTHMWLEKGEYDVRVKAKNTKGVMSEYSNPLPVKMPKNHYLFSMMYPDVLLHFLTFKEQ